MTDRRPIYLDHHAHAPLDARVAAVMADAWVQFDANPHSAHRPGQDAHRAVEAARLQVAGLLGAEPSEIVFTSGATEANNLAIRGCVARLSELGRDAAAVSAGEHPSVLSPADAVYAGGVTRIPLDPDGVVRLDALRAAVQAGAGLVSVAAANHEIGTLQPVAEVADAAHGGGALMHSDLAQAAGRVPVDCSVLDLASVSSHKLGGPLGIGALMIRRRLRRHLRPCMVGGGQEGGLRPGTVPVALCVAFGEACRLAAAEMGVEAGRVAALRDDLLLRLSAAGGMMVNGGTPRLPGNLNVSFEGVDGEALTMRLRDVVAISTGSACTSRSLEPSHVLRAIGLAGARAEAAIRFGLGRSTTAADVGEAADAVVAAVAVLRSARRKVA